MSTLAVPQSLAALDAAEDYHVRSLDAIRAAKRIILTFDPDQNPTKYRGKKIAVALMEYLEERGGEARKCDALSALQLGGCDLGERPLANLSTTVTRNPQIFKSRGERIALQQTQAA